MLESARGAFAAEIREGRGGRSAHEAFSDRFDELLRSIVDEARPLARSKVAVAALGGYGRRALCLHSDIDLLVVFEGKLGRSEERFVKALLHPLWDLKLQVGHQIRLLADFAELERDNPLYLLASLDARFLAGDESLFASARERFDRSVRDARGEMLEALLGLIAERHAQFNHTLYQLEPDLKDSPGGLRDVAAARLLLQLGQSGKSARPTGVRAGGTGAVDDQRLEQAEDFLLRVRAVLHLEMGRNWNQLTHELQEVVADRLGCFGQGPRQRVETLMGEYFRHARAIARRVERARRWARSEEPMAAPLALGSNLLLDRDGVLFADEERASGSPASWLDAIEIALDRGVALHPATLALFERRGAALTTDDLMPRAEDRQRLLRLLRPRPGLYARLSELHDCGLLERLFPELRAIACRVVRDFFHKYTVDEHTLLTIRGIERLGAGSPAPPNTGTSDRPGSALPPAIPRVSPEDRSRERFSSILAELDRPELLILALLYHDIGKWKDEDHAEESVRMAQTMLDRMEIEGEARGTVEFLIEQHIQMSLVAFRRDTEDPSVVRKFARLVGTEEHLKMLCLITLADVEAVAAEILTPWREELLWRLYVDAYNQLTLGYADEVIESGQDAVESLVARRPADLDEADLRRFLEGFPRRYLSLFDADAVYRHARLARDIRPDDVHCFLEQKGDVWELTVVTLDRAFLFSNLCGVLSYFGMDILRGSAMTGPSGLVLDVFQFTDGQGFLRINAGGAEQLESVLRDAVAGRQDVSALLARREGGLLHTSPPRRVEPLVRFDQEHSQRYTVLEIVAQDAPGLLHRISLAISRQGCDVDLVLISTEGDRAIDVFHLTKGGAKLSESAQLALKEDVQAMLEGRNR
jgi:[protein-PII] uridylyltransferase